MIGHQLVFLIRIRLQRMQTYAVFQCLIIHVIISPCQPKIALVLTVLVRPVSIK